ncbi:hypothetical protein DFP72DRAFT_870308 [Ephemerocybe angulata]|uniref:TEA domain-containing protein n=1 Tax=Ephemerocybe angulata TaxID=980116 RepID=A0A8H6IIP7_9AGAR|nr:hypothetical protein DFP72DRAFT_870308 [Tulosesus angulatus]
MKKDHHQDSLTPQRKHRKLLKDGSGVEVWPEAIEKTFVQGLREYWASPYATYFPFLVDYLQRHGIQRTKKQVASHIQVLRNMWKGQPEFHLVAGGDEQVDPVTHIPIKEEGMDANGLMPFEWDDRESSHSASPTSLHPIPKQKLFPLDSNGFGVKQETSPGSLYFHSTTQIASPTTSPNGNYQHSLPEYGAKPPYPYSPSTQYSPTTTSYPRYTPNRVTTLYLYAEGMTPFSVNVDALGQSSPSPRPTYGLRIKLSVPVLNDVRSPPALHGFTASVAVAAVWSSAAKCTTKVMSGNTCIFEECEALQVSHIGTSGVVHAMLPESSLSRCRWLDPNTPTTLTQELTVDDQVLLYLIYDLDRKNGFMPSAEFLGFQHYKQDKSNSSSASSTSGAVPALYPTSQSSSHSRRVPQSSVPYSVPSNPYSVVPSIPMSR